MTVMAMKGFDGPVRADEVVWTWPGQIAHGLIFWFMWNKLPGSYFFFIDTRRL
jgi:hypothetical protein